MAIPSPGAIPKEACNMQKIALLFTHQGPVDLSAEQPKHPAQATSLRHKWQECLKVQFVALPPLAKQAHNSAEHLTRAACTAPANACALIAQLGCCSRKAGISQNALKGSIRSLLSFYTFGQTQ